MAKLPEYIPFTDTLTVRGKNGDTTIELRGLNLMDLTEIFKTHLPDLGALAGMVDANGGTNMDEKGMMQVATNIVGQAPGLVANIIARAADDPTWVESAARLPFMAQVDGITKVARLTFDEIGGVKKTMAAIKQMATAEGGLSSVTDGQG